MGSMKRGKTKGRNLEAVALHVIAFHPMHPAQVGAHGESRSEDMADADTDIVAVIGVSLSRSGGIVGAEKSRRYIFEFLLIRIPPVEPGFVAEVVVNAAAVLVRIVRQGLTAVQLPVNATVQRCRDKS